MSFAVMRIDGDVTRIAYANLPEAWREERGLKPYVGKVVPHPRLTDAFERRKAIVHDAVLAETLAFFSTSDPSKAVNAPEILESAAYRKVVVAPVFVEGRRWGGITVGSNDLTDEDIATVTLFTLHVTSAIETADTIERLEQRNRELEAVHTIATTRLDSDAGEQTYQLLHTIADATRSQACSIHLYDPSTQEYVLQSRAYGAPASLMSGYRRFHVDPAELRMSNQHVSEVLMSRDELIAAGIRWLGIVPLESEGQPVAFVSLGRSTQQGFSPAELHTAEILGVQVVALLERTRLYNELSQRVRQLSLLFELARAGTTLREMGPIVDRVLGLMIEHDLPCEVARRSSTRRA